ncbi:MAG TPA: SBBP repeat-containing protein, partial [Blastocatellia bacterium]|nr:SBBP repeat-containing protein [Blastocatellia bacterium]
MNPSLPHNETTRFAVLALCLVCVTATTPTFDGAASPDRIRTAALRGEPAFEAHLRSAAQLQVLSQPDPVTRSRLNDALARIPMCFETNQGQAASNAQFVSAGSGQRLLLSPSAATLEPRQSSSDEDKPLTMNLVSADPAAEIRGLDLLPTRANYFIGNDRSTWHANIPTFARVICEKVYPGVDMIYHGTQRQLEYDFVVGPGADPDRIRLRFEGAQKTSVDSFGNLIIQAKDAEIRHNKPVAYQESEGVRREVAVAFSLFADGTAGFEVGDYDRTRDLVIDPVLVFSTYLGGSGSDTGRGIFVDSAGRAYVLGDSRSSDFTHGTADNTDIFVGAFTASGGTFSYTFFGGSKNDFATGLAVDADGNAYISGSTQSENLGGPNSINPALSGPSDAFVAKLNPIDGTFAYSTLIGGTGDETGVSIAIDGDGNAYIAGTTTSTDLATVNAVQPNYGGGNTDAFVAKISPDGASLVYSTYLGGFREENRFESSGIAVDSAGNAYVTGDTVSGDFPLKDPIKSNNAGGGSNLDGFVSKIDPTGSAFVYSTFLGGVEDD